MSTTKSRSLERVRYYPRQLMTAEDMSAEQDYFVERMRRHNRLFHGWGILCGLEVQPAAMLGKPWQVRVCPGDACSATGDEIHVPAPVLFDLARASQPEDDDGSPCPCPPGPPMGSAASEVRVHYLAIRYLCRPARPVRTGHTDCGCAENNCETSRYRDDFELTLLADLPVPYDEKSVKEENEWLAKLKAASASSSLSGLPTPPCHLRPAGPWVILATVRGDLSDPPPTLPVLDVLPAIAVVALGPSRRAPAASAPTTPATPATRVSSVQPATVSPASAPPPLSPLDRALGQTLSGEGRRLLPRVQDLLGVHVNLPTQ